MKQTSRIRIGTVGLALVLTALGAHSDAAADRDESQDVEGTWIVTVTPPFGAPTATGFGSYARGGVLITSPDHLPPIPGLGTVTGNGQGSWRSVGHRQFVSTHVEIRLGSVGEILGTAKVSVTMRLTSANTFEGHGQLVFCDAIVEHCSTPSGMSTISGKRLPAEAPIF